MNLVKSHALSNWWAGMRAVVTLAKAQVLTNTLDFLECGLNLCWAVIAMQTPGAHPRLTKSQFSGASREPSFLSDFLHDSF